MHLPALKVICSLPKHGSKMCFYLQSTTAVQLFLYVVFKFTNDNRRIQRNWNQSIFLSKFELNMKKFEQNSYQSLNLIFTKEFFACYCLNDSHKFLSFRRNKKSQKEHTWLIFEYASKVDQHFQQYHIFKIIFNVWFQLSNSKYYFFYIFLHFDFSYFALSRCFVTWTWRKQISILF